MTAITLTGITPSGTPHIGNYIGAIKPAIAKQNGQKQSLYFIADYHSLIKLWEPQQRQQYVDEIAASWLALGLDPTQCCFYRQSDIPEILELTWILTSLTAKGLMNRAHAYKDAVAKNIDGGKKDLDNAITMGLYSYPILMAADILAFNASEVPVGKDQIQHLEMARDIAARFNHVYGDTFSLPKAIVNDHNHTLPGLDGRKMSKSYHNTIPLFVDSKKLRKFIMKIKTNSQQPEESKSTEDCHLFQIYQAFATEKETQTIATRYQQGGLGWGEMKQILFEKIDAEIAPARHTYQQLINDKNLIDKTLAQGAANAREIATPLLAQVRKQIGIR